MQTLKCLLCALGILAAPPLASATASDQNDMSAQTVAETSPVLRTTVVVQDMDGALSLFRDVLGLSVRLDLPLSGEAVSSLLGYGDTTARIVILQSGDLEIANVALMQISAATPAATDGAASRLRTGDVAIVMETNNIDAVYAKVMELGYEALTPPIVIFERPNMVTQNREFIFRGPEGIAVNLIQRGIAATDE